VDYTANGKRMLGYSVRGSVNGGETRAWLVHVRPTRAVGGSRQVLIDGDKTAGYRTAALLHRATPGRAALCDGSLRQSPRLSKSNYRWLSLKTRLIELIWGSDRANDDGIPLISPRLRVSTPP